LCGDAGAGASAAGTLRSVLPATLAGPTIQRCDHCTHGVTAAWDTEAGVVTSAYWLGSSSSSGAVGGSPGGDAVDNGQPQTSGWSWVLSQQLQNAAAMGIQIASHPTVDGSTLQLAAHMLPRALLITNLICLDMLDCTWGTSV
jgi:hypothetical protein